MIDELNVPATDLWKYINDTTISEMLSKNQDSQIQAAVDTLVNHATADRFQLKKSKCKELCINICTKTNTMSFDSVVVNSMPIGYQWQCLLVTIAKILGLNHTCPINTNGYDSSN